MGGEPRGVGGENHVVHAPEWVFGGERLLLEDVQGGAGDLAAAQRLDEWVELHDATAADVDEEGGALHLGELGGIEQATRLGRLRGADGNEVGSGEQVVQPVRTPQLGDLGRLVLAPRIDGDDAHAVRRGALRYAVTDPTESDDAERRFRQVDDFDVPRRPVTLELAADGGV